VALRNGWFNIQNGGYGYWETFNGAFKMQFFNGCKPIYTGSKVKGFFACTDYFGEPVGMLDSIEFNPMVIYYTIQKVAPKYCDEVIMPGGMPDIE
jgi:hypothetical protein